MQDGSLRLTDIVGFERLQQLQDNFAGSTHISCIILDAQGAPLTRMSKPNALCTMVATASLDDTACHCHPPLNEALLRGEAQRAICPYSGLENIFLPFVYHGQYLGCWVLYQTRSGSRPVSPSALSAAALKLDIAPGLLEGAAGSVTALSDTGLAFAVAALGQLIALLCDELWAPALPHIERTLQLVNKFMNDHNTGMAIFDKATGRMLLANGHYAQWAEKGPDALFGKTMPQLRAEGVEVFEAATGLEDLLDENGIPREPAQWNDYSARHGTWLRCTCQVLYWLDGHLAQMVTFRDVTTERRMQDELSRLAYYDQQMNLPNSLKLAADLEPLWHNVRAQEDWLISFDISSLRRINDAHGRKAGDAFLRTVIKWIDHQNLPGATIYRIEGDEFCIRLTGTTHDRAVQVATRIFDRFAELWSLVINGQQISVLCGVSVSVLGLHSLTGEDELLNVIQRTLDISRKDKKIVVYDESTDIELRGHIEVQLSLKKCIKQRMNGFEVHYQPIVDPPTGLWKGLEALCRWTSPDVGPISPLVFIHEAEQMGLINRIGEWVLETSVRQCKAWGLDKVSGFFLSVNLSPVQIMSTSLIHTTMEILRRFDWPGDKLCLEVTESTRLDFDTHTLAVINDLCEKGIMIALDDFGTGYSTFTNMKNLPVSIVKTDHTFIQGVEQDRYMQYFYNVITELAHKTGMRLVVEGVETQAQLDIMLKNGVDLIQGYFFGRPMPAQDLAQQLEKFTVPTLPEQRSPMEADGISNDGKLGYLIGTDTFNLQTKCMQLLLSEADIDKAISETLALVGEYFSVSRACVFQQVKGSVYSNSHEWCTAGIAPQKHELAAVDVNGLWPGWLPLLEKEGMVAATDISHLPADMIGPLAEKNIRAIAAVPMVYQEEIIGFLSLEDQDSYRCWQSEELVMLKNLAMMMASGLTKRKLASGQSLQEVSFSALLDNLPLPALISDLGTGEVLWANKALRQRASGPVEGQKCFKVLGRCEATHCDECRAMSLLEEEAPAPLVRRHRHGSHTSLIYNCLVPMGGGKNVHLEYSIDITDQLEAAKLESDPLESLRQALRSAEISNLPKRPGDKR